MPLTQNPEGEYGISHHLFVTAQAKREGFPKKRCAWGCTPPRTPFFRANPLAG